MIKKSGMLTEPSGASLTAHMPGTETKTLKIKPTTMTVVHLDPLLSKMMEVAAPTRQKTAMRAKTPELMTVPQPNLFVSSGEITESIAASCRFVWKANNKQTQAPEENKTFHGFASASPVGVSSVGGGSST